MGMIRGLALGSFLGSFFLMTFFFFATFRGRFGPPTGRRQFLNQLFSCQLSGILPALCSVNYMSIGNQHWQRARANDKSEGSTASRASGTLRTERSSTVGGRDVHFKMCEGRESSGVRGMSTNLLRCCFKTSNHGKRALKDLPTLSSRRQKSVTKSKKDEEKYES
jgi:hypothetical protein